MAFGEDRYLSCQASCTADYGSRHAVTSPSPKMAEPLRVEGLLGLCPYALFFHWRDASARQSLNAFPPLQQLTPGTGF